MAIEQDMFRAARAKEVLENEEFASAMGEIRKELTEQWMQSPARDQDGREKLWLMLKMADKLEATLRKTIDTGKLAKAELAYQQTLAERARSLVGLD